MTDVSELTGFPEMMDGRVKTLHPKVHGGLLAIRGNAEHEAAAKAHGIPPIDLLVVNLYPVRGDGREGRRLRHVRREHRHRRSGDDPRRGEEPRRRRRWSSSRPTMRACSTRWRSHGGATTLKLRRELAQKAYARTAAYDGAISNWLGAVVDHPEGKAEGFPRTFSVQFGKAQAMRYGENPHQKAAFYVARDAAPGSIATARQLQGKELSYNNIADTDAALECVKEFADKPGVRDRQARQPVRRRRGRQPAGRLRPRASRPTPSRRSAASSPSIANSTPRRRRAIVERQFVEVIIAPSVSTRRRGDRGGQEERAPAGVRRMAGDRPRPRLDWKKVNGGLLVQDADLALYDQLKVVTKRQPTAAEMADLLFAWKVAKFVKSNAIVYAKDGATVGVGAGQMSRVNSVTHRRHQGRAGRSSRSRARSSRRTRSSRSPTV